MVLVVLHCPARGKRLATVLQRELHNLAANCSAFALRLYRINMVTDGPSLATTCASDSLSNGLVCHASSGLRDVMAYMSRRGHQWPAASGMRKLPHEGPLPALAAPRMLGQVKRYGNLCAGFEAGQAVFASWLF